MLKRGHKNVGVVFTQYLEVLAILKEGGGKKFTFFKMGGGHKKCYPFLRGGGITCFGKEIWIGSRYYLLAVQYDQNYRVVDIFWCR